MNYILPKRVGAYDDLLKGHVYGQFVKNTYYALMSICEWYKNAIACTDMFSYVSQAKDCHTH